MMGLHLDNTHVEGDVKGLAPLVKLTYLHLRNTKVAGDVKGLAPLVELTYLTLGHTQVAGCAAFCSEAGGFFILF